MEESKKPLQDFFNNFFKVAIQSKTYTNIAYLLLSLPLGVFYFVFFITGLALGVSLTVLFVGLPILMFMFYISKCFMAFERMMAGSLLGIEIPASDMAEMPVNGFWARFIAQIFNLKSWKSLIYLLIKFPVGIFSFVVTVTLLAVGLGLTASPIVYGSILQSLNIDIFRYDMFSYLAPGYFSSFEKSLIYMIAGIFITFVFLHIINFIAYASGKFIAVMSGDWN